MRILVSSPTFLPTVGGAELGIHEIYDRLGRDHDVVVVAPKPGDMDPAVELDHSSANYRVERLLPELDSAPALLRKGIRRTPAAYLAEFERVARGFRPDVLNPHFLMRQSGAALAVGRQLGVPVAVSLVARSDVIHRQPAWRRSWSRWVLGQADAVFANSSYYLQGEPQSAKVHVIPYGVDLEAYSPAARSATVRAELGLADDDFAVVSVQRLQPVKRVDVLIHAARVAIERNPKVVLVIVGKGSELESLRALAASFGIEDRVRFAGYVAEEDLPGVYASCDAFGFHSLHETFGVVFAQAMACGLPVVAAATSCIPEVVHPENGALVPPFDIEAMAGEWLRFAADDELRSAVSARNRGRAEAEFGWDSIARQYEDVLARVVGSDAPTTAADLAAPVVSPVTPAVPVAVTHEPSAEPPRAPTAAPGPSRSNDDPPAEREPARPAAPQTFLSIQYLRAVAALSVVVFHALLETGYSDWYVAALSGGVDVFFVISGFIMWATTVNRSTSTRAFWRRRLERIVPLYWLATTVAVAVAAVAPSIGGATSLWHVVSSYAFLPAVSPDTGKYEPIVSPGWTLNYEMAFYLLFGLALVLARPGVRLLLLVGALGASVFLLGAVADSTAAIFYSDSIILEFAFGLALGWLVVGGVRVPRWGALAFMVAAVVGFALVDVSGGSRAVSFGLPALLLVAGAVFAEAPRGLALYRPLRLCGDASYSIYLAHGMVLAVVVKVGEKAGLPSLALVAAATILAVVAGLVVYRLLERPMLDYLRARRRRSTIHPVEVPA